jgi:hypothetical protein
MMKDQTLGLNCVFVVRVSYSKTSRGGNSSIGCIDRYAAKERASMKVMLAPWEALAMAVRTKRLVKDDVERAIHVATVKGLNRKLCGISKCYPQRAAYPIPCCYGDTAPSQVLPRRCEQSRGHRLSAIRHLRQRIGAQEIHYSV